MAAVSNPSRPKPVHHDSLSDTNTSPSLSPSFPPRDFDRLSPRLSSAVPYSPDQSPLPSPDGPLAAAANTHRHHSSSLSVSSVSRPHRSGGIFALAAAALDRTVATISDPKVRTRQSLSRLSIFGGSDAALYPAEPSPSDGTLRHRTPSNLSSASSAQLNHLGDSLHSGPLSPAREHPPSQPYSETDPNCPPPKFLTRTDDMHQTSSRLLRMTDDDRPFTKDFKDLFSTLIVSLLPLSAHRVRLTKVEHTFLSEDAINNLGSLKFSQSNRMPDPKDPSRIVTTTTTTTFSMAKDMARSICQRFLDARFIESADGKYQAVYSMKGSVWQLTPKGICILDRFCARNGIQQKQVGDLIGNNISQLVILERDQQTDKLVTDRGTVEVIFRRFVGTRGPNIKPTVSSADSESLSDYRDGLTGVKMASERKVGGKTFKDTFTGRAATDWLMDCSTMVDRREAVEVSSLFVEYGLIESIQQDRLYMQQFPASHLFQPTKAAIYRLTEKGKELISGASTRGRASEGDNGSASAKAGIARDSNTQRLDKILNDAALRLLFRENLRETHCEENLSFYLDVDDFVRNCRQAVRAAQKNPGSTSNDGVKEIMAQAYGIYNAFLAPGSPCELNIDHQLRNSLATRMTRAVSQDVSMVDTLVEVTELFEDAQAAVFKLMASDSVPKFLRSSKYEQTLSRYDLDAAHVPERSQSRSNRK